MEILEIPDEKALRICWNIRKDAEFVLFSSFFTSQNVLTAVTERRLLLTLYYNFKSGGSRPRSRCGATYVGMHHARQARLFNRAGVQVNLHHPLVHALPQHLQAFPSALKSRNGAPFGADRDLGTGKTIERGGLHRQTPPECRNQATTLGVSVVDVLIQSLAASRC